jgi:parallel beta-helix repeat protein
MKLGRLAICALLLVAIGCGDDDDSSAGGIVVRPGESIQAAVDAAMPGDTVTVMPGDYTEPHSNRAAVRITKPLKLIAMSTDQDKVRILPGEGQTSGILVEPENFGDPDVDGVDIKGFTVEGFDNNGIWLRFVQNFTIEDNEAANNLENGIWPTLSANGLVKNNVSYGALDSALWVEASENVRVIGNELYNSPTGFEVTVSNEVYAEDNDIHDNTVGVGLYHPSSAGLPPLEPVERNGFWQVVNNHIHDNNFPNPAPEGSIVAELPPGIGILVTGVDNLEIEGNLIENNDFLGIALTNYCVVVAGTRADCEDNPPEVEDVNPENNSVIGNTLVNNHSDPPPGPFQPFAADILEVADPDSGNCYSDNVIENTPPLEPLTIPEMLPPC